MPKVTVDGTEIDVLVGATVLQACELERRIEEHNAQFAEAAE